MRSDYEESRLARAAADGDGQAFAQLYDRYEKPIYNYCLRLLGNEHDAQDATQDAFLKIMRRLPEMGDREFAFGPYLFTTARNASYDMIARRKKAEPVDEFGDASSPVTGSGPTLDEDPVRKAMLESERETIRAANSRLPARQREVLALRQIQDMSYDEIATVMEMNANSVAQLISRARIRLRQELRGEAATAIQASSPECEKALPLLARRQDGKLTSSEEQSWLEDHLAGCTTCPIADAAMAEAGISYRAWAPVLPAAWLFRDTLAKAAEIAGTDWSEVERPGQREGSSTDLAGAGNGSAPITDAARVENGSTPITDAARVESRRHRRWRRSLVGLLATGLLLAVLGSAVFGDSKNEATERPAAPTGDPASAKAAKKEAKPKAKNRPKARNGGKKAGKKPNSGPEPEPPPATTATQPIPASTPQPDPQSEGVASPPTREQRSSQEKQKPVDGKGSWGESRQPETSPDPSPQPDPTPTDEPPTTTPTPTDPPDRRDPPSTGGPNDPVTTQPPRRGCQPACGIAPIP